MLISCKKSCIMDNNENCEFWAENGECGKNPGYMLSYCQKSCS